MAKTKTKMTLTAAIKSGNIDNIKEVVNAAVEVAKNAAIADATQGKAVKPTTIQDNEPEINTVYGDVPVSMLTDDETVIQLATQELVQIKKAVAALPKDANVEVEVARLITNSATLRYIANEPAADTGLL